MKVIGYLISGGEYMPINDKMEITRQGNKDFSGRWVLKGAWKYNNFGTLTMQIFGRDVFKIKDWQYKNGKQKWYMHDIDHGKERERISPRHSVSLI